MFRTKVLLALITLCVGLVSSFSWDIVVARSNRLEFYNEGILEHLATPASHRINWIYYDPVHERVLFSEKYNSEDSASSFVIANQTTQSLIKNKADRYLKRFAYDPATELLFGTVTKSIYSFPLASGNNEVNGDLVITLETVPREVAVDSCGGYVYWTTNNIIERALFNGSEREVIIENNVTLRQGLTIDTQKIYWIESQEFSDGGFSIESADLNGNNRRTLYSDIESDSIPDKLTVSKDFISWGDSIEKFFWQLPKHPSNDRDIKPNKIAMNTTIFGCVSHDIVGNYKIEERTRRVPKCNALLSLLPDYHVCLKASEFCVHGTKVIGESRCDCIKGYIGERCDVSVCENYCLQGDCSVSDDGQPKCRCKAGHTGTRCEVNACYKHCLNNGVCFLNEEDKAVCECTGQYKGERCDVLTTLKSGRTSYVEDRTPIAMNETMERTTASSTSVENNITYKTTTDTQTKIQENIVPTTNKNSVTETSEITYADKIYTTTKDHTMKTTTASNTDDGNIVYATTTTETPMPMLTTLASNTVVDYTLTTLIAEPMAMSLLQKPYEKFHWLSLVDGKLPPNAIVGGSEDGNPIYIARASISDSWCPGKYVASTGVAYFPWGSKEHTKEKFEILCGHNPKWVKTDYDNIPKNAFVGGTTESGNEPLYICRVKIQGRLICGKVHGSHKRCYLPFKGEEENSNSYEILVEE